MAKKPSMGRQKIKIAKIEIKNHLQVTFSKRRSGLYKKAHELSTLCGVELAIVVFSPAGKVFSFGNPNVDYIVDKFISRNKAPPPRSAALNIPAVEGHNIRNSTVRELNSQLTQIVNEMEAEKRSGEACERLKAGRKNQCCWWESPVDELGLHQLEQVRDSMEELKKMVAEEAAGKAMAEASVAINASSFLQPAAAGSVFYQYESKPTIRFNNIYSYGYDENGLF